MNVAIKLLSKTSKIHFLKLLKNDQLKYYFKKIKENFLIKKRNACERTAFGVYVYII